MQKRDYFIFIYKNLRLFFKLKSLLKIKDYIKYEKIK